MSERKEHTGDCVKQNEAAKRQHDRELQGMNGPGVPFMGVPGMFRFSYRCVCGEV